MARISEEYKQYVEWMQLIDDIPLSYAQWQELAQAIDRGQS